VGFFLGSGFTLRGRCEYEIVFMEPPHSYSYMIQALLPLQTDPILASLHRNPKTHRTSSPTRQTPGYNPPISHGSSHTIAPSGSSSHPHIDVRTIALRGFRDQIIFPLSPRLYARLSMPNRLLENEGYMEPRCNQMCVCPPFPVSTVDTEARF